MVFLKGQILLVNQSENLFSNTKCIQGKTSGRAIMDSIFHAMSKKSFFKFDKFLFVKVLLIKLGESAKLI